MELIAFKSSSSKHVKFALHIRFNEIAELTDRQTNTRKQKAEGRHRPTKLN